MWCSFCFCRTILEFFKFPFTGQTVAAFVGFKSCAFNFLASLLCKQPSIETPRHTDLLNVFIFFMIYERLWDVFPITLSTFAFPDQTKSTTMYCHRRHRIYDLLITNISLPVSLLRNRKWHQTWQQGCKQCLFFFSWINPRPQLFSLAFGI